LNGGKALHVLNAAPRADGKTRFLLDKTLKPNSELDRIDTSAGKSRVACILLCGGHDHLFYAGLGIAK
jgi:hypothetical protein